MPKKKAKKKKKKGTCEQGSGRNGKGQFAKGYSGNPAGGAKSPWRDELEEAIITVQKRKRKKLMVHAVEQAFVDNKVLVAILKKFLPDLKSGELNVSGEISLKPPTVK